MQLIRPLLRADRAVDNRQPVFFRFDFVEEITGTQSMIDRDPDIEFLCQFDTCQNIVLLHMDF